MCNSKRVFCAICWITHAACRNCYIGAYLARMGFVKESGVYIKHLD